jgi:hypothetical protein
MNRPPVDSSERLLETDATDFERRLLQAAQATGPSRAASARMARTLGVTAGVAATTGAVKTLAAVGAASKATAVAGTSAVPAWIAAGVIGLVAVGAVVGARAWRAPRPAPRSAPVLAPAQPPQAPDEPAQPAVAPSLEPPRSAAGPSRRTHAVTTAPELRDQIEILDAARASLSSGADRRALDLLRRYEDRYPGGSFRPEATALKVEALVKLGRRPEARALAQRFVAEHRGSLLAARVAELAGVSP